MASIGPLKDVHRRLGPHGAVRFMRFVDDFENLGSVARELARSLRLARILLRDQHCKLYRFTLL